MDLGKGHISDMLPCRSSTSYLGPKWIPGNTLPAIIAHKKRVPKMMGLSVTCLGSSQKGGYSGQGVTIGRLSPFLVFKTFDFAFLGSSVSGILVAPALAWATHGHSQAAMASMHALGRLASTPLNCASLSRVEEGGSVANRAMKPRKIRSQDEGAKTRAMAVESHRLFPS
ncbi:uncharacterized protein N7498_005653 [Penicillium cinerascens]|uniref:Uncharacterized protein n=1 Tax=Penicillium cinerascens TaxID=70096 RepID=A0A9W9MNZ4_9EURO|nr:uncharacterized protein N7498_005653 [Penicillium cinerascens]KAJ5204774.1 hypothetical protein N7498_005653 [Penicillium cinerascens]